MISVADVHVHHINGNPHDNRPENILIMDGTGSAVADLVCRVCHQQLRYSPSGDPSFGYGNFVDEDNNGNGWWVCRAKADVPLPPNLSPDQRRTFWHEPRGTQSLTRTLILEGLREIERDLR